MRGQKASSLVIDRPGDVGRLQAVGASKTEAFTLYSGISLVPELTDEGRTDR